MIWFLHVYDYMKGHHTRIIGKLWYDSYLNEFSFDSYISFQHDSDIIVFYISIICGEIEIKKRYGSSSP